MSEQLQQEFNTLPSGVKRLMERADGYLDLRMPHRARELLNQVPESVTGMNIYRTFRMRLYMEEENWQEAADAAAELMIAFPDNSEFVINLAYAVRRFKNIQKAEEILRNGLLQFPDQAVFSYNLGCYAAVQGNEDAAVSHLKQAFSIDEAYREMAADDEDLSSIRHLLGRLTP